MNQTNPTNSITPSQIPEIIFRRRWIIIIPFLIASITGCYFAITLPKIYQSSTSILIQPQKVPGDYIKSIVSTDINSRLATISQQILSRSNLEKIIDRFKLNRKSKSS
ncbi:MAG: protein GumC, partial [bacterium]|nr:protein GumC [bacterium]